MLDLKIPPFSEFVQSVDMSKLNYDINRFATEDLRHSSCLFTEEQYAFLTSTAVTMQLALLAQYHQWLSEQLP